MAIRAESARREHGPTLAPELQNEIKTFAPEPELVRVTASISEPEENDQVLEQAPEKQNRSFGPSVAERVTDAPRKILYGLYTASQAFAGGAVGAIMGWQIAAFFGVATASVFFVPIVVATALFTAAGLAVSALWDYFHYRSY